MKVEDRVHKMQAAQQAKLQAQQAAEQKAAADDE